MDLSKLDELAYKMSPLPAGLKMPETYYFLTMRSLYAMFAAGQITAEQARQEKMLVIRNYNQFNLVHRIGEHDMHVLRKIQSNADYYDKNGCPVCKALANQICGLAVELTTDPVEGGA